MANLTDLKANAFSDIVSTIVNTTNIIPTTPKVTSIIYPGDDTAANTGGGQTITITGTGFSAGVSILINAVYAGVVTVVSNTNITFVAPAQNAGTYTLYVINSDGGTAISIPGISYSGTPTWSTAAGSLATSYETAAISNSLTATGDPTISYSLFSGTLPPGSSLNSSTGLLSGTSQGVASSTTYNFTIRATDGQNQDTDRAFSITINPDVVTWSSPADNSTTTAYEYSPISNVTMSATSVAGKSITFTANSLPTGVTITGNTISGTPTVVANTNTRLTANSANTFKTATKDINFVVNPDVVTWSSPADGTSTALFQDQLMANVTLSATSAAGKSITYSANTLPTGVSINGANVSGTPTVSGTTNSLITATAATTNRTATRTFNWVISVANDTFFNNTTLLLNGETTVTPFISDASTNGFGLTIAGDTKPTLFNPYTPGYYSVNFPNNTTVSASNANLAIGTGDFTIECWAMPQVIADALAIFMTSNNSAFSTPFGFLLRFGGTTSWQLAIGNGSVEIYNVTRTLATYGGGVGVWTHHAIVRSGGTLRWYINGVQAYSVSDSTDFNQTYLGFGNYAGYYWNGYISNFRIVKGTGLYTSAFTPPTSPLTAISGTSVLALQSNRLIDSSTNTITLTPSGSPAISPNIPFTANASYSTYGSTYFNGSTDYLQTGNPNSMSFGTGDFTIETWVYPTALTANHSFFVINNKQFYYTSTGILTFYSAGTVATGPSAVTINNWQHVALVRSSGMVTIYLNGVPGTPASYTTSITDTTNKYIGAYSNGSDRMTGYMSNLRVTTTAVYTSSFTPPTTPLTAIANTSLLTLQYNGGATNYGIIDNSNFNNIITRSGNATQGTFSPYSQTGWSNYFNGSAGYITSASSTNNALGSGDYTIEFWCYSNSLGRSSAGSPFYADASGYQQLIRHNGSVWECYYKSGTSFTSVSIPTGSITLNAWTHHALVRNSGTVKWYINGAQQGSASDSTNFTASTYFQLGNYASLIYDGYVSNVRVVKGTAVYTSAFTPPTSPLTPITGTIFLTAQSNRFIDNGPLNTALTITSTPSVQAYSPFGSISEATPISYSTYIDGTSNVNLLTPASSALVLGSNNWTIEAWIYLPVATGSSSTFYIASNRYLNDATNGSGPLITILNQKLYIKDAGTALYNTQPTTLSINTWYHIAVCRSGSSIYSFINGVQEGTTFTYGTLPTYGGNQIGIGYDDNFGFTSVVGYISNLRVVNGTALYTSAFTPSTAPLTAITNTSLLTCQSSTIVDNSVNKLTFTSAGTPKVYKYNPFGYTAQSATSYTPSIHGGSTYYDGTGDGLSTPNNAGFKFGTGDFTVEFWLYDPGIKSGSDYIYLNAAAYGNWGLIKTAHVLYWQDYIAGNSVVSGPNISSLGLYNTWIHIAVVRKSSSSTIYVNGVGYGTTADTRDYQGTGALTIGLLTNYGATQAYISDIRITNGISIYKSNFVPPIQTLTNYSTTYPATLLLNFNNGGIVDQHSSNVLESVGSVQLSTSVKKYNNASIYQDGTASYLSTPLSTFTIPASTDFTIEGWFYFTSWTSMNAIYNTGSIYEYLGVRSTGTSIEWSTINGQNRYAVSLSLNTWYHIAATRSGSTLRMFLNGSGLTVGEQNTIATDAIMTTTPLKIGYYTNAAYALNGYIDDLRITKGYARYTSNFTAPTSALITK